MITIINKALPITLAIFLMTTCVAKAQVPQNGTLLVPVQVPLTMNGQAVGSVTLPKGTPVKVLQYSGDKICISTTSGSVWINKDEIQLQQVVVASTPAPGTSIPETANAAPAGEKPFTPFGVDANGVAPKIAAPHKAAAPTKRLKVLMPHGPGPIPNAIEATLRNLGYQVDQRDEVVIDPKAYSKGFKPSVTEEDIAKYDVFWIRNLQPGQSGYSPAILDKILTTKNKILIINGNHDFISEIRKYGNHPETLQDYSSMRNTPDNLKGNFRGLLDSDGQLVEVDPGSDDGCAIITLENFIIQARPGHPAPPAITDAEFATTKVIPVVENLVNILETTGKTNNGTIAVAPSAPESAHPRGEALTAAEQTEVKAKEGNADALFAQGENYYYGWKGSPKDKQKAAKLFQQSADLGNFIAQHYLGMMYLTGEGMTLNYEKALDLFQKSAAKGWKYSQYQLGLMYVQGKGVPKDEATGAQWIEKAANQGDMDAEHKIAEMYQNGQGVQQNTETAKMWFDKEKAAKAAAVKSKIAAQ